MRIFYAADDSPNPDLRSEIWKRNLYYPLVDLGHDVVTFDYAWGDTWKNLDPANDVSRAFIEEHRPKLEEELVRQIERRHKEKPIDLFFSYFYSAICRPRAIEHIKSLGIATANWYCNASYQFHLIEELAPAYDACFVPEKFRLDDYRRAGAKPLYVQEAANPTFYRPYALGREYPVTFVGQKYGDRGDIVRCLLNQGIDVKVFGPGWANGAQTRAGAIGASLRRALSMPVRDALPVGVAHGPLSDEELVRMYSKSEVSLGFSSCGETHKGERILQIRLRDFEAPMSGAFYLVEHFDELGEFFDIGSEIVTYEGKEDLADKIRWFLAHPNERERIRYLGRLRALADHSWHRRFQDAFRAMGLPS